MSKAAVLGSPVTFILGFPAQPVFFFVGDGLAPSSQHFFGMLRI